MKQKLGLGADSHVSLPKQLSLQDYLDVPQLSGEKKNATILPHYPTYAQGRH